jgi:dCMP deaminase
MNTWDRRFLGLALFYSSFSKDPSTKVGCVLVNDKNVPVGLGYNGFSRHSKDLPEILNDRPEKYKRTIHAEENAIYNRTGDIEGSIAYLTHPPCVPCVNRLSQNGIKDVRFIQGTDEDFYERWNLGESVSEIEELKMTYQSYVMNDDEKDKIFMEVMKSWRS